MQPARVRLAFRRRRPLSCEVGGLYLARARRHASPTIMSIVVAGSRGRGGIDWLLTSWAPSIDNPYLLRKNTLLPYSIRKRGIVTCSPSFVAPQAGDLEPGFARRPPILKPLLSKVGRRFLRRPSDQPRKKDEQGKRTSSFASSRAPDRRARCCLDGPTPLVMTKCEWRVTRWSGL